MTLDIAFAFGNLHNMEEFKCQKLEDLSLETQLRLLKALKTFKDYEKGKTREKGFSNTLNCNHSRNPNVFTSAEATAASIFDAFELSYVHELSIKLKDGKNRSHRYLLDFFFPESRIDVEISPPFHWTYRIVAIRDVLKERLLKRAGISVYHVKAHVKKLNGVIKCVPDVKELQKIAHMVKETQNKPECLGFWI